MAWRVVGWRGIQKRSRRFYEPTAPRSGRKSLLGLDRDLAGLGLLAFGELDGQHPMLEGRRRFLRIHIGLERERAGEVPCGHCHFAYEVRPVGFRRFALTGTLHRQHAVFNRGFHILGIPARQGHLEAEPIAVLPRVAIGRPHRSLAARELERLVEQTIDLEIKWVMRHECHGALLTCRYLY